MKYSSTTGLTWGYLMWETGDRFYLSGDTSSLLQSCAHQHFRCLASHTNFLDCISFGHHQGCKSAFMCVWDGSKHCLLLFVPLWMPHRAGQKAGFPTVTLTKVRHSIWCWENHQCFSHFMVSLEAGCQFSKSHFVEVFPLYKSLSTQWPCDMQIHCAWIPILSLCQHAFC